MRNTVKTLIIGLATVMPLFLTSFTPNEPNEYLANRFAAPAAQRKCAQQNWTWFYSSGKIANNPKKQYCKHADYVSNPTFNPIPVMERL